MTCFPILLSLVLTAQPLANEDVLEPSVQNEVDHALDSVPTNAVPPTAAGAAFAHVFETNRLSATACAIRLISTQRNGSWFYLGTNVTPVAVQILRRLSGER